MSKNIYKKFFTEYIEKGYSVVPAKYASKAAGLRELQVYKDKLPTLEEGREMASKMDTIGSSNLDLNLGEVSGVVVLDFDSTNQKIIDLIEPLLPSSPVSKFGTKGFSRFFRYNGERSETLNFNGEVVFEILSNNKKTTIPPSVHPAGSDYIWNGEKELLDINKEDLPLLPPILMTSIEQVLRDKFGGESSKRGKIANGRNSFLSSQLGILLKDEAKSGDQIINELIAIDKETNNVPYFTDSNDQPHTCAYTNALSFYSSHLQSINGKNFRQNKEYITPAFEAISIDKVKEINSLGKIQKVTQKRKSKAEFIVANSAIKSITDTINKNSWVKQPELALGAALTIVATLACRKFTFQGLAPNLYVCNISESGSGKNAALEFTKKVMNDVGAKYLLGAGDYVSNASLVDSLEQRPTRLDVMDEVGGKLKTMNSGGAEYSDKIGDILAELYTSSNSYYMGRALASQYGTPTVRGACKKPNVNILAATTPTGFREGVTKDALAKGLMGRFLLFFGNPNNKSERVHEYATLDEKIQEHLLTLVKFDYKLNPDNAMSESPMDQYEMEASEEANTLLDLTFSEFDTLRLEKIGKAEAPIAARLYQQMIKLCMVHCLARPFEVLPQIEICDVQFAKGIILEYYKELDDIVNKYIFNSKLEKDRFFIKDIIDTKGMIPMFELVRLTPGFNKRTRQNVIEDLIEAQYIGLETVRDDVNQRINVVYYSKENSQ